MKADFSKIQNGELTAFRQFFEDFFPSLYFFAHKILEDEVVSRDIAQEAFILFWEKHSAFFSAHSAKAYLFKIVKNKCLNHLRDDNNDKRIRPEEIEIPDTFNDFLIENETYRIIHEAVESLPAQESKVIQLALEGLKMQEIANQLKISVNTVKTLKSRAYKYLRKELRELTLFFILHKRRKN